MGYHNPDLYYHNLIMDLTFDKTNLKNKVKRLEREIQNQNQQIKQLKESLKCQH